MLTIVACCAGFYLGLHFNVLSLVPLTLLGAGAYIATTSFAGHNLIDSLLGLVAPIVALQAGYVLGLTLRDVYGQIVLRFRVEQSRRA